MKRFYLNSFFRAPRPLVFAHRGGAALAPENTIDAFDNGLALGADGIELDVHLSRDGVVVVHHDDTLARTTGRGGRVADCTADDLAHVHAPRLSTVLSRYPHTRVIVELKVNSEDLAAATVDVVRSSRAVDRVCLGSVGLRVLKAARRLEPAIATSAAREEVRWALYRSWCRVPVSKVSYSGYQVPEFSGETRVVSPRFVADAHRAGLGVQIWTVDDPAEAQRLIGWGADALITDRPDVIVPLVGAAC
jgi:glycerophosphoryl diester phosphodiesterase